jgi:hypothetical protein
MNVRIGDIATVRQGLSRSGRSVGARQGDAKVRLVSGTNIQDDQIIEGGLEAILIHESEFTAKHLLRPYDVVVTGKSTAVKAAYVPPSVVGAIANSTLIVVSPHDADMGLYLWWYLTSREGRRMVESRMVAGITLSSLLPSALADIEVPLPAPAQLRLLGQLIEAAEQAYRTAIEAARIRRSAVRDYLMQTLRESDSRQGVTQWR